MHRWTVGSVEIVRIEDLDFAVPSDQPVPDWCMPGLCALDETRSASRSRRSPSSPTANASSSIRGWRTTSLATNPTPLTIASRLLDELSATGFPAESVDVVVNTHLDGIGWNTVPDRRGLDTGVPQRPLPLPRRRAGRDRPAASRSTATRALAELRSHTRGRGRSTLRSRSPRRCHCARTRPQLRSRRGAHRER